MEENKPGLTVISGGKDESPKGREAPKPEKLTAKQALFAEGLAAGKTNSEAYREAYGTEGMKPSSVHVEACKLAKHPKIEQRVSELLAEKKARNSILTEKQTDRVWRNVWRLAEGQEVPPSVQQAALSLAAKMAGMLTDRVEIKNENVDSKSLEAELLERLQRLTG